MPLPIVSVSVYLSVLFAVGPLRGVHPTVCVRLEVLPEAGAGGEALAAGLTPVRLVACVNSPVVHKIPF